MLASAAQFSLSYAPVYAFLHLNGIELLLFTADADTVAVLVVGIDAIGTATLIDVGG